MEPFQWHDEALLPIGECFEDQPQPAPHDWASVLYTAWQMMQQHTGVTQLVDIRHHDMQDSKLDHHEHRADLILEATKGPKDKPVRLVGGTTYTFEIRLRACPVAPQRAASRPTTAWMRVRLLQRGNGRADRIAYSR
ncbi:hypothetical protein [Streptomyces sp. NPDC058755]|uniref:hypothetical protein n=1 Tax=Streptomyces sp. NPDC058755 TaxID=3346624 RepID=UPI00367B3F84